MSADVKLAWNPVLDRDLDHYKIYRDATVVGVSSSASFTDKNVPDGSYTYEVSAVDTHGNESVISGPITRTVPEDTTSPGDPFNLRYRLEPDHDVKLLWDHPAPEKVKHFEIWVDRGAGYLLIDITTAQQFIYIEPIPVSATYKFKIRAVSKYDIDSNYSNEVTVTPTGPGTAVDLRLKRFFEGSGIRLVWDMPDQVDIDYFLIYHKLDAGAYAIIGRSTAQTFEHRGLPSNHIYTYKMTAVDNSGYEGAFSNIISLTIPEIPTPINLRSRIRGGDLDLFWDVEEISGRFVHFDIIKQFLLLFDDFNYAGVPDPTIWSTIGAPTVNGTDLVAAAGESVTSLDSFLFGTFKVSVTSSAAINRCMLVSAGLDHIFISSVNATTLDFSTAVGGLSETTSITTTPFAAHVYEMVWSASSVILKIDSATVATHTAKVPQVAMPIRLWAFSSSLTVNEVQFSPGPPLNIGSTRQQNFTDRNPSPSKALFSIRNLHVLNESKTSTPLQVLFPPLTQPPIFDGMINAGTQNVRFLIETPDDRDDLTWELQVDKNTGGAPPTQWETIMQSSGSGQNFTWYWDTFYALNTWDFRIRSYNSLGQISPWSATLTLVIP